MVGKLRILVVTDDPGGSAVEDAVAEIAGDREVELKVVAPIRPASNLDLLTGEVDDSIAAAGERAERSASDGEGADQVAGAEAEVGDADQLLAIEDALATFDADQVLLVAPDGDLLDEARERLDRPVSAAGGG